MPDEHDRIALHVVATAGHVDHGKSSLLVRLTGIDPDRLDEEKRRGLTIDLGFAWCALPSGREVGFVDVPGHERFVRNMLAGVGPVRLVLFVVAADEGWKPQSEEHLQILDVLGVDDGVVALTKLDLVDDETLAIAGEEVRERIAGTVLDGARVVACSSATGEGLEQLVAELDAMLARAPAPERAGRARLHVDRVFSIAGAGTVVTGTLTGAPIAVGEEVTLLPGDVRARIRGLQTHKRRLERAEPISRVAVNLVGAERADVRRGDVLTHPGRWRPTAVFEASIRIVRGVAHPVSARGAYKLYAGAAEREARLRIYGGARLSAGERGYARVRVSAPLVLAVGDRFVIREAGRGETVAGGTVLDPEPPRRAGADPAGRLGARESTAANALPALVVAEREAIPEGELTLVLGDEPRRIDGAVRAGGWWISAAAFDAAARAAVEALEAYHRANPIEPGMAAPALRERVRAVLSSSARPAADAVLQTLLERGTLARDGASVRLPGHRPAVEADVERVVAAVAAAEPTPPTIGQLVAAGHPRAVVDAAIRAGDLVRVSPELVFTRGFVDRAVEEIRAAGRPGLTVSALRERLGTSRKYAVPLVEHLDQRGLTIRRGDVRVARGALG